MPSSGMKSVEPEVAIKVLARFRRAEEYGLTVEWFMWFIGGVQEGKDPIEAAQQACFEWDV